MNRILVIFGVLAAAAIVTWRFPLFHVVPLKESEAKRQADAFDADKFAAAFWTDRLTPALADAHDASTVLAALTADADAARKQFGRSVGISRSSFFFVRGAGTLVAVEKSRVGVAFDAAAAEPDLWLVTGPIFGNAAHNATGLIKSQDFSDSQDFNALAAALNALVEKSVLPPLRNNARSGQKIQFVACVEVPGGKVRQPLKLIPLETTLD